MAERWARGEEFASRINRAVERAGVGFAAGGGEELAGAGVLALGC
jgi:hypothetical protein